MNKYIRKLTVAGLGLVSLLLVAGCGSNTNATSPTLNADISNSVALAYDPSDGSLLKADHTGLQRWHTNAGWQTIKTPQDSNLSSVVVNPDKPTTLYISGLGLGVARSDDGGQTWQTANTGLPNLNVTALAIHSSQRNTLFAWLVDKGFYRTIDGGETWKEIRDKSIPDKNVYGAMFSPLPGSMNTGWLYADTPTGAYLSMDCFCGWRTMGKLPVNTAVRSIAVDPQTPQRVYVAGPSGLFRADDSGFEWKQADKGLTDKPLAVTLNPAQPSNVFTVLADGSVWQSKDGATTWEVLKIGQ